jgi:hypothetical protein
MLLAGLTALLALAHPVAHAAFDHRTHLFIPTWLSIQAYSKAWSRSLS